MQFCASNQRLRARIFSALAILLLVLNCQYNYFHQALDREKDTDGPTIQQAEPARNSTIRKLDTLRVTFSEPVKNADIAGNYTLSGDGLGSLALSSATMAGESEVILRFSGTMVDGNVAIKIAGVVDKVENPLRDTDLSFVSDATPKWRYIGRGVSRRQIAVNFGPSIATDSQYLYAAITESFCFDGTSSQTDISIMRYDLNSGAWSVVGDYCLGGATLASTSVFPSLLAHNGNLFVAFTDGTTFDGTNKFVRVRIFKNNQWDVLGNPLPAQVGANATSASLTADGDNIYLSVRDIGNGNKVSVYRNTITTPGAWTLMGTNGLSAGNVFRQAPVRVFNNEIYVGYRDGGSVGPAGKPSVLKWDGATTWSSTGAVDTLASDYVNLVPTATELWAVYQQGGTSTVAAMKYSAGTWSSGATTLTTEGTPNYLSAAISGTTLYAGYQVASSTTCRVKKYEAAAWSELGNGITCGNPTITMVNGLVYAVYRDQDASYTNRLSAAYFQ